MHDLKEIRKNFDDFKKKLQLRNVDINLDEIINYDKINREKIKIKEDLEQQKKLLSKIKKNYLIILRTIL